MDLSILIISYNTRELTLACLASVFAQTHGCEFEVIVVDNASSDGSAEAIAEQFPRVNLVRNAENRGFAAANNQGMRCAHGRYVLLLNSDTLVLENVLADSVEYMDQHRDVGVMGCRVLNPDRTLQPTCFQYPSLINIVLLVSGLDRLPWPLFFGRHKMSGWLRDSERDVDVVTGCYFLVRTGVIEEVGLLDESFFFCGEETDWCQRIHAAGWRIRFAPVGEIIHIGNASGKHYRFRRDLMLSEGLVRLHRKHAGLVTAAIVWLLLLLFNASRAAIWGAVAAFTWRTWAIEKFGHFLRVTGSFNQAWPALRNIDVVAQAPAHSPSL
jgi:GT2 family glycosyltransferase